MNVIERADATGSLADYAAEIGKGARLARVVGERKILAVIGARDVRVLERWARPAAAGKRECGEDKPGHCPQVSAHAKK